MKYKTGVGVLLLVLAAGCQSLPGLRVLTGEDSAEAASARVADQVDLVMADKTGDVDSSVLEAADRIEAAAGNVDVVEIRRDLVNDQFMVFMMIRPDGDPTSDQQQDIIDFYNSYRRAVEMAWTATLRESERFDVLNIQFLVPQVVSTLDNGPSFIGFTQIEVKILREEAVDYLARPHDLNTFIQMVIDGRMTFEPPETTQLYIGQPNHPMFMVDTTQS